MIERPTGYSDREYEEYIEKCNKFDREQRESQRPKFISDEEKPVAWLVLGIVIFLVAMRIIKGQV